MTKIKIKIENSFERSGRFFYTYAKLVLVLLFIFIAVIAWQIPNMALDPSVEGTLDPDHQTRINYNEFRDQFGRAEVIIVTAESDDIFSSEFFFFLHQLRAISLLSTNFILPAALKYQNSQWNETECH